MASLLAIWCWVTNFILRLRSGSVRGGQLRLSHLPIACCLEGL
ncbi:hypothetical protein [Microcoleus sp. Z1_C4]